MPELDDKLAKIETEVAALGQTASKIDVLQGQLNTLTTLLQEKKQEVKEEKKESTVVGEAWWDEFKTKPVEVIEQVAKKAAAEAKKEVIHEVASDKQKGYYDNLATTEYPELLDTASAIRMEYQKVSAEKIREDPKYFDKPTAVYDTAQIAYARLIKQGKIMPDYVKDDMQRQFYTNDGKPLPVNRVSDNRNPDSLTQGEAIWAKKLNVKPEKYVAMKKKLIGDNRYPK